MKMVGLFLVLCNLCRAEVAEDKNARPVLNTPGLFRFKTLSWSYFTTKGGGKTFSFAYPPNKRLHVPHIVCCCTFK